MFGSIDFQISEKWELSGGVRYTEEDRSSVGGNLHENGLGFSPGGVFYTPSDKADNVSPEVTLSYNITDDVMTYVAFKTGFQSAGISNPGTVANLTAAQLDQARTHAKDLREAGLHQLAETLTRLVEADTDRVEAWFQTGARAAMLAHVLARTS